jgi:protease-4
MSKSTKWFLAIFLTLAVIGVGFMFVFYSVVRTAGESRTETVTFGRGDKIAVVELKGVITSSEEVVRQLKKYRDDGSIKGILLRIDSPGGAVVPSQEMYEEVKKTRAEKPVIASMGSVAASGGYYVACGASRLVANRGTLTGSIGVISEFLQLHEALAKLGIDVKTIKAGKLKDAGSNTTKMNPDHEKYFQNLMDDVHKQFIAVVEDARDLEHSDAVALADGRVFTGEQAVKLGLVDTLGTYEEAIQIAGEMCGIEGEPSLVKERERKSFFDRMFEVDEKMEAVKKEFLEKPILSYRFNGPF